jgi:hypothetical protein
MTVTLSFLVLHVSSESKSWSCGVFNADIAIFSSFDIKKDGDNVTIFTGTAIQMKQDIQLTQGGILLMAVLGGGDYNMVCSCALMAHLPNTYFFVFRLVS